MRCTEVEWLLGRYLGHELDLRQHHAVENHLQGCSACQAVVAEETELCAALSDPELHQLAGQPLVAQVPLPEPASLPADFTAGILARLAVAEAAPDEAQSLLARGWHSMRQWDRQRWMNASVTTAAAAAVILVWVNAPGVQSAVMDSQVGVVISPVVKGADQMQASVVNAFAELKVLGLQLSVIWHQLW